MSLTTVRLVEAAIRAARRRCVLAGAAALDVVGAALATGAVWRLVP